MEKQSKSYQLFLRTMYISTSIGQNHKNTHKHKILHFHSQISWTWEWSKEIVEVIV